MTVRKMALLWAILAIVIMAGVVGFRATLPVEAAPREAYSASLTGTSGVATEALHVAPGGRHTCALTSASGVICWGDNGFGQLGDGTTTDRAAPVDVSGLDSGVTAIAGGASHTCALTQAGGVKCWGRNGHGQLGDGTTTDRAAPVDVSGLDSGVTAITAGEAHTCAVTSVGGVKCWGSNENGQLGVRFNGDEDTPVAVAGLGNDVAAIATGKAHTCALRGAGNVWCWGKNDDGQLGDGTTTGQWTPVAVVGLETGVVAVAGGQDHTCALTRAGGVKCWGANTYGQLGDGTIMSHHTPADVNGLGSGVSSLAAGALHTCAVMDAGGVKCWGNNRFGQLGDGTWISSRTPVAVGRLGSGVTSIAARESHVCAVTSAGGVQCWGKNSDGQLGSGTPAMKRSTPTDVVGLGSGVVAVEAGSLFTCALTSAGGVKCWGDNGYRQLGDGTKTYLRATPADVVGLGSGVSAIAVGQSHACALTSAGAVKCWGKNDDGQLGDGTGMNIRETPTDAVGLSSGVTAIAAGDAHTCALMGAGGVKCWGYNGYGQLGGGTTEYHSALPVDVPGLSGVTAIALGGNHTCALMGGGVKCWGDNSYGQLGNGTTTDSAAPVAVVGLNSGVTAIAAGWSHTCALTSAGGVKCWGHNYYGQLGAGTQGPSLSTPTDVVGLDNGVSAIAAGMLHTCAVVAAGGVKCWGRNEFGQLGDGTLTDSTAPVSVQGLSSATAISLGSSHTCAVTSAGGVQCWGKNSDGQLGDGTAGESRASPAFVSGLTGGLAAVAANYQHSCALTNAGGVKCWGWNSAGQLGDGSRTNRSTAVDVIGLGSGVSAIATGNSHTCALTTSGGVKCWGSNQYGQLGDGSIANTVAPVDVVGLSGVVAIAAGGGHTCAVTSAGGVKCWGANWYGQLGDGTTTDRWSAVDVTGLTAVAAITTGNSHTCVLTTSGGVKCWGKNDYGQLGDGTTANRSTPGDVSGLSSGVAAIASGSWHTCAVTSIGGARCWGWNHHGQIGDGTNADSLTPADVVGLDSGVAAIAAGDFHTCAITNAGGARCWGANGFGALGDGTTTPRWTPVDVMGLSSGVRAITVAGNHTCALTGAAPVQCWGNNPYGQLGDGTTTGSPVPLAALGFGPHAVTSTAQATSTTATLFGRGKPLGSTTSYFFEYGTSPAYGRIAPAQTGDVGVGGWESPRADLTGLLPGVTYHYRLIAVNSDGVAIGRNGAFVAQRSYRLNLPHLARSFSRQTPGPVGPYLAAGGSHTCALTDLGRIQCWGNNHYGQLGDGTTADRLTPVGVEGLDASVAAITAGGIHTCTLTSVGGVKCWGRNERGQLGNGMIYDSALPVEVTGLNSGVKVVVGGNNHTCAITSVGGLMCWGWNSFGQLGNGTTYFGPTAIPTAVNGLSRGIAAVAPGAWHTCALTSAGGVKCWGYNYNGQLGDGTTASRYEPVDVVGLDRGVAAISVGVAHTCALMRTGGVKCWGSNLSGELGDGTTTDRSTPVDVGGLGGGATAIAVGASHTCVLTREGGVKCWGYNASGQLGDGTTVNAHAPVDVTGLGNGMTAIAGGGEHTCALTQAGGVKCWGSNYFGQLGDGTTTDRSTPVDVVGLSGVGPPR